MCSNQSDGIRLCLCASHGKELSFSPGCSLLESSHHTVRKPNLAYAEELVRGHVEVLQLTAPGSTVLVQTHPAGRGQRKNLSPELTHLQQGQKDDGHHAQLSERTEILLTASHVSLRSPQPPAAQPCCVRNHRCNPRPRSTD
ncbi:uncharacterized protein LOC118144345 [Callithrix jacchus]